jgi:hypothetical protein
MQLARLCLLRASAAKTSMVANALRRMVEQYQARAAALKGAERLDIMEGALACSAPRPFERRTAAARPVRQRRCSVLIFHAEAPVMWRSHPYAKISSVTRICNGRISCTPAREFAACAPDLIKVRRMPTTAPIRSYPPWWRRACRAAFRIPQSCPARSGARSPN